MLYRQYSNMSRIDQLVSIIALLDQTSEEDYPALRENIIAHGELVDLPVPYNPFALGIQLAGYNPATVEREGLRACLVTVLQIAYASAWILA